LPNGAGWTLSWTASSNYAKATIGKKKPIDPELRAEWAEARRQLEGRIKYLDARAEERREREARRRRRLQRFSFGLLGRA
jgi:hypothetical protein